MLVNTIARGKLTSKKGVKPSEREIELNINLALYAVELVKSSCGEETKQISEHFNMFKMAGRNTKDESVEEEAPRQGIAGLLGRLFSPVDWFWTQTSNSRYFNPLPVLKTNTQSSGWIHLLETRFSSAAMVAAASNETNIPSRTASLC